MFIYRKHQLVVGTFGLVANATAWDFPSSNVVDLVRSLSDLFGQDPLLTVVNNHHEPST
jgi:ESCRT-I complex subunit TSG101